MAKTRVYSLLRRMSPTSPSAGTPQFAALLIEANGRPRYA
jgi:hypothetical protein